MKLRRKNWRGLSLIGVMVALAMFAGISIAVMQMIARSEHIASASRNRFIALGLAREGLELIQQTRDSNWFQTDPSLMTYWTGQGICGSEDDTSSERRLLADRSAGMVILKTDVSKSELYLGADGFYSHNVNGQSFFSRIITIDCANQANPPAGDVPASIEVTSTVSWPGNSVALKERLYNWYRL